MLSSSQHDSKHTACHTPFDGCQPDDRGVNPLALSGRGGRGLAGVCTTLAIFYFSGNLRSMVCALLVLVGVIVGTVISASLLLRSDRYR
jgi:hypothetical protein